MNFVPCVTWVGRSKAASTPHKLQLSPEELKRLVDETKKLSEQSFPEEETDEEENSADERDQENEEELEKNDENAADDDDFDSRYNLDSYDNDDEQNPVFRINDLAVHVDNHDDEYITDGESEGDLEEKEDYQIKDSDNLLISGHIEEQSSVLEIHVYNQEDDVFYVHHDIVLESYPLCLTWLDFHPADDQPGNYVAVGDMSSVIKIYDLDVVDVLEPDYTLGKLKKSNKKKSKYHTEAVLSLSWNKNVRNLLASGSADSSVIVWDLSEGTVLNKLSFHSNKVQAVEWHPTESQFLLSACTDGYLKLYDCQSDDECKSWQISGEIEKVVWDMSNSFRFFCSTDQGCIYTLDIRNEGIEKCLQAHKEAVTGLDISPLRPDILISASMDRTLKVWDLNDDYKMIKSLKLKVGSIYCAKVVPDLDLTVAAGGNNASNSLKVIDIFKGNEVSQNNVNNESEDTKIESEKSEVRHEQKKKVKKGNLDSQINVNNEYVYTKVKTENNEQKQKKGKNKSLKSYETADERELEINYKKKRKHFVTEDNEESEFAASTSVEVARKHKQKNFKREK